MIRRLTPELARSNPRYFQKEVLEHMAKTTELGAQAWNTGVDTGVVDPDRFELNTDSWVSQSNAAGRLVLGTQPMTEHERARMLFQGENLSYADEVARRLLHEIGHGALWLAKGDPKMKELRELSLSVREQTEGRRGLSALGSHPFYREPNIKSDEDTTELLTMRMVGEDHLDEYTALLNDPRYERVRQGHGLVTLEDSSYLNEVVKSAVREALSKAR